MWHSTVALSKTNQGHGPEPEWHREKNSSRSEKPHQWSWPRQLSAVGVIMAYVTMNNQCKLRRKLVVSLQAYSCKELGKFRVSGSYKNSQVIAG